MEIVNKNINNLKPYEKNPRINDEAVKLCDDLIKNSSRQGDNVLDLFGGSGSTMMACEQL